MAGLGRKVFTAGEVLTAAAVQGFLMDQAVMVFASSAARSSAIPTPDEGMFTFLKDTDQFQYWTGSAYENVSVSISGGTAGQAYVSNGTAAPGFGNISGAFITTPVLTVTAAHTATSADRNELIVANGTAAYSITIPDVLNIGDRIDVVRNSSGTVTIACGTGITSWAGAGTAGTAVTFKIDQQFNGATVFKTGAAEYRVIGKIIP